MADNALLKVRPELFNEWDFEKNGELGYSVYKVTRGITKKAWWICPKCESSYDMVIGDRSNGSNCPYCKGLRVNHTNSLATKNPQLALEWHPTLNGELTPHDIPCNTVKKVWWKCNNCTSSYDASVAKRNRNRKCSYCSGRKVNHTNSLAALNPNLALEWHPTNNGNLTPHDVTCNNGKKAWWKCQEHGHEWEASVCNRNRGRNCPTCSNKVFLVGFNDMWTTNPELSKLLANSQEGFINTESSHKKVNWKCPICKDLIENKAIYNVNKNGVNCPNCSDNISFPEKMMFHLLRQLDICFVSQKSFEWLNNRRYDFYLPDYSTIIEVHGMQHYNKSFQTGRDLVEEQENDKHKRESALRNGISEYIEINSKISDFEYIKKNIIESKLDNIFNLNCVDWDEINLNSLKSFNVEILNLWNKGNTLKEISVIVQMHHATISKVVRNYHKLGLCVYEKRKR